MARSVLAALCTDHFKESLMDATPAAPAPKRARVKVATKPIATDTEATKKPRIRKKLAPTATAAAESPSEEQMHGMIATAAYFLAAERNFEPGHELEDWLVAERSVRAQIVIPNS
jgi:hypothetical protein